MRDYSDAAVYMATKPSSFAAWSWKSGQDRIVKIRAFVNPYGNTHPSGDVGIESRSILIRNGQVMSDGKKLIYSSGKPIDIVMLGVLQSEDAAIDEETNFEYGQDLERELGFEVKTFASGSGATMLLVVGGVLAALAVMSRKK